MLDYSSLITDISSEAYQKQSKELMNISFSGDWHASVVMAIVDDHVFFIKRSKNHISHQSQLAFIGGVRKEDEDEPWETSQREWAEETAISASALNFKGYAPPVYTSHSFLILPTVVEVELSLEEFTNQIQKNHEWSFGILCPLTELLDLDNWCMANRIGAKSNGTLLFFNINNNDEKIVCAEEDKQLPLLWGATARIAWNVLKLTQCQKP